MQQSQLFGEVVPVFVEDELKRSYLDYAMSVIVGRALPDVRDGLKPVHRRILYAMIEGGFDYNKPHRKSANVVGQVFAKYHPHGMEPIYEAMVRMAQKFSMRLPLVSGHGNFGSMDGDKAAAMRYTEARLSHAAHFLLEDYDKATVDFQLNYDETLEMPTVLPARFPNLLVNGASGIAVGMATNIPPHNLEELIDACCYMIDKKMDVSLQDLSAFIQGPDFPTGGIIITDTGLVDGYSTGRGSFLIRGRHHIESIKKEREAIIITEIPYQVNKALLIERIADLVSQKELEGISDLRDESDRHGVRIVLELKKDVVSEVVLNKLYAMTSLQTSFGINMLVIHRGQPQQMSLVDILAAFLEFRKEVVVRRTQFYLHKARDKVQVVVGLLVAVQRIDEVIALIKASEDHAHALSALQRKEWPLESSIAEYLARLDLLPQGSSGASYFLSEDQAKAILALRLSRLTNMERGKLQDELTELQAAIDTYLGLLGSDEKLFSMIKEEMQEVRRLFPMPRKTLVQIQSLKSVSMEDMIPCEEMVVTVSVNGYIKRVPLTTYRSQKRGGRGRHAMMTREEDAVSQVFVADTHTPLLFFTSLGQVYQMKVHELPLGSATSRGKPLVTCFPFSEDEKLTTILSLPKASEECPEFIIFATSHGMVRKNALEDFLSIRSNGKIAMKLSPGEKLIAVVLSHGQEDILLSSRYGKSIRFGVGELRKFAGRNSTGVRGMNLKKGDSVVSMSLLSSTQYSSEDTESYLRRHHGEEGEEGATVSSEQLWTSMEKDEEFVLCISEQGFGKRTSSYAYRRIKRGGQGVATMEVTERTGYIVNACPVKDTDHILLLTNEGQLLRCPVEKIRISGRKTQGVRVFRLAENGEHIVSMAAIPQEEEGPEDESSSPEGHMESPEENLLSLE